MNKAALIFFLLLSMLCVPIKGQQVDHGNIREDLRELLYNIERHYIYLHEKKVDLDCLKAHYESLIPQIRTTEETILFFEYLLDEFYDSHLILNTNTPSSFRLYSPLYVRIEDNRPVIANVWQTQIKNLPPQLIGAELVAINGIDFNKAIEQFPTHCHDKSLAEIREWIANKILAGRYNQPRILTIKSTNGKTRELDLGQLVIRKDAELLASETKDGIAIIRLNNSLGNNRLIGEFDRILDSMMHTSGLILDLRNTVDGGNTYVARAIMGRFTRTPQPYQKHWTIEQYGKNPKVERSWIEYVSPRGSLYKQPVVILVGRWTGSMGEGLAIGFEGMGRAKVVGTEMERLAGEVNGFSFLHQTYGYRLSTAKLFHVKGVPREKYVPPIYVKQTGTETDQVLERGLEELKKLISQSH
ncbi:MAG: hypothetical protein D6730_12210 [Bacteroidetes bacterium]|nr:MAG: hypothetical protein D6730_12210 [Bacteroidota bacterium]